MLSQSMSVEAKTVTRAWGWFLVAGIAWIVFAFILLSFNYRTVWAIAVFFGIGFIIGGIMELAVAAMTPGWKWLHILLGIVSIIAGLFPLIWPGETLLVLGAIVGWLLLFYGVVDIVFPFSTRDLDNLWWMQLIAGIIMVAIGFGRSVPTARPCPTIAGSCCSSSGSGPPRPIPWHLGHRRRVPTPLGEQAGRGPSAALIGGLVRRR